VTMRVAEEVARAGGLARARALLAGNEAAVSDVRADRAAVLAAADMALAPLPPAS
jgi:hypothetical protein